MANGVVTPADITSVDWSFALDSPDLIGSGIGNVVQGAADVDQCLRIIFSTPKGTDPLRPTFGTDVWQYVDYPINAAIPAIVREVTASITLWEPRVRLVRVKAVPVAGADNQAWASLSVVVLWSLKLGQGVSQTNGQIQATTMQIPGPAAAR
jgi:hypothetical protein